jgi:cation transport protein ChaC
MPRAPRVMRLTAEHVARVHRDIPDPGPQSLPGYRHATDEDHAESVAGMLATRPEGPFWLFGISSLIWNPETAFVERRMATARGWHRRFCIGMEYRFRGNRQHPGVMMALDRGGSCKGAVYRLPEEGLEAELHKLSRRERSTTPASFPWRWIDVDAGDGMTIRALAFPMDRKSNRYAGHLSEDEIVGMLATACGFRGSMAEYLLQTVSMLESLGIHDRNLWRLQELVAERIERNHLS